MPLPDGYFPRRDDVLILHARVKHNVRGDDTTHVFVRPEGHYADIMLELDSVVGVHALHWDEGARIQSIGDNPVAGVVIGTHDDRVWVKFDSGGFATRGATELRPEPNPEPVAKTDELGPRLVDTAAPEAPEAPEPAAAPGEQA